MPAADVEIRNLLPLERISSARLREAIRACPDLAHWSCGAPSAIRPTLLARLVRDALWEALSIKFREVCQALDKPFSCEQVELPLILEVETVPGKPLSLELLAVFSRCPSGRIAIALTVTCGGTDFELLGGRVVLAASAPA